ncbi:predicted protein [Naegleria gruberi]|uniref:Predicted protein n=1 Tax=Naegleria gruberi TaxID=5762 RepID=D2V1S4_NAEGR|nr:uncharacterized protein NAEGRDRAFT_62678 [Naegleria gruberi]EFC49211.1 predicted protein [Naegleria gruberi]|eukprot:XP_002681955.1 predicted protein [Naegleria gruberi strain NEG-M]
MSQIPPSSSTTTLYAVQFSGHIDLTEEEFKQYYLSHLEESISNNEQIYVGGAKGADELTQKFAQKLISETKTSFKLMIVCDLKNDDFRVDKRFDCRKGFLNHTARDEMMTKNTSRDVAFIRYKPMSLGSGTLANILRRQFGSNISKKFKRHARDLYAKATDQESKELFDEIIETFVKNMESMKGKYGLEKLPQVIHSHTMGYGNN